MLTLYQAEWCPFSSAVREILTELGLDFVARQVEAWHRGRFLAHLPARESDSVGRLVEHFHRPDHAEARSSSATSSRPPAA